MPLHTSDFKDKFKKSNDVVIRELYVAENKNLPVTLMFIDGLIDINKISEHILKPLSTNPHFENLKNQAQVISKITSGVIYYANMKITSDEEQIVDGLLSGNCILLFEKVQQAVTLEVKGFERRSIGMPIEESTFRESKDSLVETLRMNTASIRLKIKSENLVIEESKIGKQTKTSIAVMYMKNICNDRFVSEINSTLNNIDTDKLIVLDDITSYLIGKKRTIFPRVLCTEKTDTLSLHLLNGKIAIIADGLPYAIILPIVLSDLFQSTSDSGVENNIISNFFLFLRYSLFFLSISLPGFYIAITMYHQEMIPDALASAIAASKAGTPFPIFVEIIFMSMFFYTLLEASLRIPKSIGSAVSIVGGLVLGDAAITAKLISPGVVVVIAATAISSLAAANHDFKFTIFILQQLIIYLSSLFGLLGLSIGFALLLSHLSSIQILGVNYLSPYCDGNLKSLKDSLFVVRESMRKYRPSYLKPKDKRRRS